MNSDGSMRYKKQALIVQFVKKCLIKSWLAL